MFRDKLPTLELAKDLQNHLRSGSKRAYLYVAQPKFITLASRVPILYKIYFVYITEIQISLSFSVFVHYQSLSLKIVYLKLSA